MISKRNLIAVILCAAGFILSNAATVNVRVETPGTLRAALGTVSLLPGSTLRVSGTLDGDDVSALRNVCGGDSAFGHTDALVDHLDLSDVDFRPGADKPFGRGSKKAYCLTGRHTMPEYMFFGCPIKSVKLPAVLDSIGTGAFSGTRLSSLAIPDGVTVTRYVISSDSLLEELRLPAMERCPDLSASELPSLRRFSVGDVDLVGAGTFNNMPRLEEIVFEGMVGHSDGFLIENCPELRKVLFRGPIGSTGGSQFVKDCPKLEKVEFGRLVLYTGIGAPVNCGALSRYDIKGAIAASDDSVWMPATELPAIARNPEFRGDLEKLSRWQKDVLVNGKNPFLKRINFWTATTTDSIARLAGYEEMHRGIAEAMAVAEKSDDIRPKLDILKDSPAYAADKAHDGVTFTYAQPSDSLLTLSRVQFNLDSIAGDGDDISKMKNLLYWVHDLVRHDGSSGNPSCPRNLRDLAAVCHDQDRGVNCRMMAIMLTEAYLAVGIPARYLTCQSKAWATDSDCHVICMAWSDSLGKWVWMDPTFAAYVTDENGLLLHPGEVRERLRKDLPLVLNEDANWNHRSKQTKKDYLDDYMAKNLYIIEAITVNQAEPEGRSDHSQGRYVALIPEGCDFTRADIITTDYDWFWQRP